MRLLNTTTKKLETFFGSNIPLYAILSHRWMPREINFQDLQDERVRHLDGFAKIEKSCRIAAASGLDYIWIDTCCIDKTSSSELSEAINSMYNWYRDSVACYVYLSDVPGKEFGESAWFTRGWTLQELLAPSTVIFFDRDWLEIGVKSSRQLCRAISKTTGIPTKILQGGDLDLASVAQKMSWAAKRETTIVEDLAYSLMGIFGVNMPMLYGEGDRAFLRLQEEIAKTTDDLSLFVWKEDGPERGSGLLAPHPRAFRFSGDIKRPKRYGAPSLTIDNRGIHLKVPLLTLRDRDHPLALVHTEADGGRAIGLWLRPISESDETLFERKTTSTFFPVEEGGGHVQGEISRHERPICVRRDRHGSQTRRRSQLWRVAAHGNDTAITFLLKQSGETANACDAAGRTLLSLAAANGNTKAARALLDRGARVDARDTCGSELTPLLHAVERGHSATMELLLREGADLGAEDKSGRSAVAIAAAHGHCEVVRLLLDRGLDAEAKDFEGRACLAHAAMQGCFQVAQMLLNRRVNPEAQDKYGLTPLALAAIHGRADMVKLLVDASVNIEARDTSGWTPLLWASGKGHKEAVKVLLESGAEPDARDHLGLTPLKQAETCRHYDIVKLLEAKLGQKELVISQVRRAWTR